MRNLYGFDLVITNKSIRFTQEMGIEYYKFKQTMKKKLNAEEY
jgi:hypothetical protein